MEEKIIQKLKGKTEGYEVLVDTITTTLVEFRGDEPYSLETKNVKGIGLRVIKDGRFGFAFTTDAGKLSDLIETALALSRYGEIARFSFPKEVKKRECRLKEEKVANLGSEKIFALGKEIIAATKGEFPQFKIDLSLEHTRSQREIINSFGLNESYEKVYYSLSFTGLIVGDDGITWIYDYANLSDGRPLSIFDFVQRQVNLAKAAQRKAKVLTKEYPILFAPAYGLVAFLLPLLVGVDGKNLQKGITPLQEKEGKEIAANLLSIYDDGLLDYGLNSSPFDGEGVAKQQTPLIEGGVFKNFLFDLQTAALCGRQSTGNGLRSYHTLPKPTPNNILVAPQTGTLFEAISEMDEGILVYDLIGGGQSNILAGDFSTSIGLGFKVEGGEIKGRVKECVIAGNLYEILKRVSQIGGELKDLGGYYLPFIKLQDVKLTAK